MLTDDLYGAISNIADSINALLDSHERETSDTVGSLCDSIDKLCKTVSDGKSINGADTALGLIAGALAGETDKIEQGASMLAKSIKGVSESLDEIGGVSDDIVNSSKNISSSMQSLSEGIESVGVKTLFSAYIAKASFPAIQAFTTSAVELLASIASKEKDLEASKKGIDALNSSIDDIKDAAGHAIIGGLASALALPMLVPISLFMTGSALVFSLADKLFSSKRMEETGKAVSAMARGIRDLAISAIIVTVASPFFILGTAALVPMSIFVVAVAGINFLVEKLFGNKKKKDYSAIGSMAKGILYMTLAAGAAIIAAPVALLAIPCVLVLGLFTLAVGALVVKPINSLVGSKEFKGFTKGILSMSLGILALGLTALSAIILTPVFLLGSLGMLATGLFVKVSGKVFRAAAKNTKDYVKGTLGLVIMSAGFLATSYLLVQAVKVGKDLLTWDTLGVLGVIAAVSYGGTKLLEVTGKALGSVVKGAVAVLLVAGTVYGASYLFNKAVTECKGLISDPESTVNGLLALVAAVGTMGAAIAAAGFALPFIAPGAAAVALVSGTVFAAAKAISSASDAWAQSQNSGAFELDEDGSSPFSKTVKGVVSSMIDATSDIDDIGKLSDSIKAIMPVCDFVQKLAVGVSEFSKIAMMKGEIADSTGKKMPFNLTKVGEGIGEVVKSVVKGIGDAMKAFDFTEDNMVDVSTGGFLGLGATKTKVPKQIAAIRHLMPLASFIGALASGVSEFSKIATMQGEISVYDEAKKQMVKRPFNLKDVGTGISAVMVALMEGVNAGISAFEEGGMTEISSGGFLGIGGDKITVPTRLVNLQHIMPLASFISSCAEMISSLGKDKNGNALTVDTQAVGGVFTGLINALNVEDIDDILEDAGDGLEDIVKPLKDFCNAGWKNLPSSDEITSFESIMDYVTKFDTSKAAAVTTGADAVTKLASVLSSDTAITGENVKDTADGITRTVEAINDLDVKKADALSNVYEAMAKAASKRSSAIKEVVKAIKDSADALVSAVDRIDTGHANNNQVAAPVYNVQSAGSSNKNVQKETRAAEPPATPVVAPKQKVTVDLTINGQGGDTWIIRRK